MGANGIDLVRPNLSECDQRGNDQGGGDQEYRLVRPEIPNRAHARCRETIANRGKAGVAAEAFSTGGMTDEPEADRGNRWVHHAAAGGVQELRPENGRKDRQ
jgi:hypothetical protein